MSFPALCEFINTNSLHKAGQGSNRSKCHSFQHVSISWGNQSRQEKQIVEVMRGANTKHVPKRVLKHDPCKTSKMSVALWSCTPWWIKEAKWEDRKNKRILFCAAVNSAQDLYTAFTRVLSEQLTVSCLHSYLLCFPKLVVAAPVHSRFSQGEE